MTQEITLFGIKNCDTVKKAQRWLDAHSIVYQFHDLRAQPLPEETLTNWLQQCGVTALINKRSATYRNLSQTQKQVIKPEDPELIALLQQQPTLIKRPVLAYREHLEIGFQPERYQLLLQLSEPLSI